MNRKERLAGFIVLATLLIGIIAGLIDRDDKEICVSNGGDTCTPKAQPENDSQLRLDLNRASVGELMALPGIGEKRARAITAWRDANGPFRCVDDLEQVRGIGPATLGRLRAFVCVKAAGGEDPGQAAGLQSAMDIAKYLLDFGLHAPTVYFPLIVKEAIMIEPTETENKETIDIFCDRMIKAVELAKEDAAAFKEYPKTLGVCRPDDTRAIKELDVCSSC